MHKKLQFFDIAGIADSGQVFRMYKRVCEPGLVICDIYARDRYLCVVQRGIDVEFTCSEAEFESIWREYFDLDTDYEVIAEGTENDEFIRSAYENSRGIRVLNQDIWEMTISFIISQQKQIPSIRKCIEALCGRFGEVKSSTDENGNEVIYRAFPTAAAIAAAGPEGLKGLSLGYRERYIYETAVQFLKRGLEDKTVKEIGYEKALAYFCSFTGIGVKVANCICLFAAGYRDAFPIDAHIKDILYREYFVGKGKQPLPNGREGLTLKQYEELVERYFGNYSPNRGIIQQWIFANEIK